MVNLHNENPDLSFTASAVELYFNDCNDLLNGKAKIPIAGQGAAKSQPISSQANYDENGKWISPAAAMLAGKTK